MTTCLIGGDNITFNNGADLATLTATANTLTLSAAGSVTLAGVNTLNVASTLQVGGVDVASQAYVAAQLDGRHYKAPVRVATTTTLPANTYSSGAGTLTANANGAFAAIDTVTIATTATTDRVLVKNEATATANGIYRLTQVGDGSNPWILTRTDDASTAAEIRNSAVFVQEGSTNVHQLWVNSNDAAITADLNTDDITFVQISGGSGLSTSSGGLTDDGTDVSIATGGVGTTQLANDAVTSAKIADGAIDTAAHIINDLIDSQHIAAGAVDLEHMAANSVDSNQYVDGSIDAVHIATDAVTTAKIANDAVTGAKLAPAIAGSHLHFTGDTLNVALLTKDPVRCASTASVNPATGLEAGDSIDGVTLVAGDRVLLKNSAGADNGIYIAVGSGAGAASRAPDADASTEMGLNVTVRVMEGTVNAGTTWKLSGSNAADTSAINVGTETQIYTRINTKVDDSTLDLVIATGAARIKAGGVGTGQLAADAVNGDKLADNAVDSEHITDGSVDMVHLANDSATLGAIGQSHIVTTNSDGNITLSGNGADDHGDITSTYGVSTFVVHASTSDRRLKENITSISAEDALNVVQKIKPVDYTWRESKKFDSGFIAQDMQEVAPHLVHTIGSGANQGKLSIEYAKLTAYNSGGIQALVARNTTLEARIEALEKAFSNSASSKRKASGEEGGDRKR